MATSVIMPKQGQSVESCIITKWHKSKGDFIKEGDVIFSYETDKASFDEEAQVSGILLDVFFAEDDDVPCLTNIAVIGEDGEATDEFRPSDVKETAKTGDSAKSDPTAAAPAATPAAQSPTPYSSLQSVTPTGEINISPRAQKTAEKLGVSANMTSGTGPGGRIIERDVINASENQRSVGSGLGGRRLEGEKITPLASSGDESSVIKLSNIRKIIATRMHESLANSAQLTMTASVDARRMQAIRSDIKKKLTAGKQTADLNLNDMICYATVRCLARRPDVNSLFLGDSIQQFNRVHFAMAVDTERGLMVPVVKNADLLSIEQLAGQLKDHAAQCKSGTIDPELLNGGTFTISNLGIFGIESFTPVINSPQSAILGVNTISLKPVNIGSGVIGIVPHIGLSLTIDHRSLDGAPAASFLKELCIEMENLSID